MFAIITAQIGSMGMGIQPQERPNLGTMNEYTMNPIILRINMIFAR